MNKGLLSTDAINIFIGAYIPLLQGSEILDDTGQVASKNYVWQNSR